MDKENIFFQGDAFSRNAVFSSKISDLLLKVCRSSAPVGATESAENVAELPFTNLQEWISHFNATWASVKHSGQMMHYKNLQEYYDRQHLSEVTTEVCHALTEQFAADVKTVERKIVLSANSTTSAREQFLIAVDTEVLPKHTKIAETDFDKRTEDRPNVIGLNEEYRRCIRQRCRILREQTLKDFQWRQNSHQAESFCQQGISTIKEWIDNAVFAQAEQSNYSVVEEQFENFWSNQRQILEDKLIAIASENGDNWSSIQDVFRNVSTLQTVSHRHNVTHDSRTNADAFGELVKACMLNDVDAYRKGDYVIGNNVAFRPQQRWCEVPDMSIQFNAMVESLAAKMIAPLSSLDSLDRRVQGIFSLLNDESDKMSTKFSCRLTEPFYSICLSYLFYTVVQQIDIAAQKKVDDIIITFDKNKSGLKSTYRQLVYSRFDDIKTAQSLVELLIEKIDSVVTTAVENEEADQVRLLCSQSSQAIVAVAETRQSSDDIYAYVTDFPMFLSQLYSEKFNSTISSLHPRAVEKVSSLRKSKLKSLLQEIDQWKETVAKDIDQLASTFHKIEAKRTLSHWSFQSLKSYLSHKEQPALNKLFGDRLNTIVMKLSNSKSAANFHVILDAVPKSFAICEPMTFCEYLRTTAIRTLNSRLVHLQLAENAVVLRTKERQLKEAIGCYEKCPLCKAKCTESNEGHITHSTEAHRLTAFAGLHTRGTRNFIFDVCTSLDARTRKYYTSNDSADLITLDEVMESRNWKVALHDDTKVENRNIFRWLKVRQRLCEHYDLDDNTPPNWLKMEECVCPICQSEWNDPECGEKRKLKCGHYLGSNCYGRLLAQTADSQICPVCRKQI